MDDDIDTFHKQHDMTPIDANDDTDEDVEMMFRSQGRTGIIKNDKTAKEFAEKA